MNICAAIPYVHAPGLISSLVRSGLDGTGRDVIVAMKDLLDTAGKEQRRGKLNCVRSALIDAIFSHQTAWLK